jgi:hypothetical protein
MSWPVPGTVVDAVPGGATWERSSRLSWGHVGSDAGARPRRATARARPARSNSTPAGSHRPFCRSRLACSSAKTAPTCRQPAGKPRPIPIVASVTQRSASQQAGPGRRRCTRKRRRRVTLIPIAYHPGPGCRITSSRRITPSRRWQLWIAASRSKPPGAAAIGPRPPVRRTRRRSPSGLGWEYGPQGRRTCDCPLRPAVCIRGPHKACSDSPWASAVSPPAARVAPIAALAAAALPYTIVAFWLPVDRLGRSEGRRRLVRGHAPCGSTDSPSCSEGRSG